MDPPLEVSTAAVLGEDSESESETDTPKSPRTRPLPRRRDRPSTKSYKDRLPKPKPEEVRDKSAEPSKEHLQSLSDLIDEYVDVFPDSLPGVPPSRGVQMAIPLVKDAQLVRRPLFRYSMLECKEIQEQLEYLLARGLITPRAAALGARQSCLYQSRMVHGACASITGDSTS